MPKLAAATPTPARIDVVFQLLTFFLMTFRVAAAEGDFELKLPRESVGIADSVNE